MRYLAGLLSICAACKHEPAAVSPSPAMEAPSPTPATEAPSPTPVAATETETSAAPAGARKSCATWTPRDGGGVEVKWPSKEDVMGEDAGASLIVKEDKPLGPGESYGSEPTWQIGRDCPIPPGFVNAFPTPTFDDEPVFIIPDAGVASGPPPLPASTTKNGLKLTERALSVVGKLPRDVVRSVLRQRIPAYRNCYAQALKANPTLKGVVAVTFVVDENGAVDQASLVAKTTTIEGNVGTCTLGVVKNSKFPAPEAGTVKVTYTLEFSEEQ